MNCQDGSCIEVPVPDQEHLCVAAAVLFFFFCLSWPLILFCFLEQLSVKNCFIRGSVVRYVQLPADEVDTQLLQDAARKEAVQQKQ